jgi:N-acetylmuramoyl-L-alanine amidase
LTATTHAWIAKDDLTLESLDESGPPPLATVRTINTAADSYGADVSIPMNQRLPFQIEQFLKPNRLVMKVFGVTANTDWVAPLSPNGANGSPLDHVTWRQVADGVYEVTAYLNGPRQWGYYADYQDTTLHLHVKSAPHLTPTGEKVLSGLNICLDPGHGGDENGAIGCGGMREADLNLGIALKLRDMLQAKGAHVIMTRTGDQVVSLDQRVQIARDNKVDILLSVHNNALPDGRDPAKEHGTSSYWYHPQAIEFARSLKSGEIKATGFEDLATRWQNLALTRPSAMIAALYEVAFVVNPDEYAVLESPAGQEKAAQGLLKGIIDYLSASSDHAQSSEQ